MTVKKRETIQGRYKEEWRFFFLKKRIFIMSSVFNINKGTYDKNYRDEQRVTMVNEVSTRRVNYLALFKSLVSLINL